MRRLQIGVRLLTAVLLALVARIVVDGLEPVSAVTAVVIGGLLVAALGLRSEGRQLEPESHQPRRDDP